MWKTETEALGRTLLTRIRAHGEPMSYAAVIDAWRTDEAFCDFFLNALSAAGALHAWRTETSGVCLASFFPS